MELSRLKQKQQQPDDDEDAPLVSSATQLGRIGDDDDEDTRSLTHSARSHH